mgnify:CR=1 FL=1
MKKKIIFLSTIITAIILIITIVVSICVINSNSSYVKVQQTQTGILIETKRNSMHVEFIDISGIEIIDTKYGNTQLDGSKWSNCEIGIFENDIYGRYYSFVEKNQINLWSYRCNLIIMLVRML